MTDYMLLWRADEDELKGTSRPDLTHLAGGQLDGLETDDVVWIVNNQLEFALIGRLVVDKIVNNKKEAESYLNGMSVFLEAKQYAIAKQDTVASMRWIPLINFAKDIRFVSSTGNDRLTIDGYRVDSNQFRRRRKLTVETTNKLTRIWYRSQSKEESLDFLLEEDDIEYVEGQIVARTVHQRVRNRKLVADAKQAFKDKHNGNLLCELCGFSFRDIYGIDDYIEAHHLEPIRDLEAESTTKIGKLKMLCANCHRALHHPKYANNIDELRKYIEERKL